MWNVIVKNTTQVVVQTNDMIATSDAATRKYNASESMLRSEKVLKYAKRLTYKNSHILYDMADVYLTGSLKELLHKIGFSSRHYERKMLCMRYLHTACTH